MALQKDITDEKGVKTRYHIIYSFEYCSASDKLEVVVHGYVNQATRAAYKNAMDTNRRVAEYAKVIDEKQGRLDSMVAEAGEEPSDEAREAIAALAAEINQLQLDPKRPQSVDVVDTHYSEVTVTVPFIEPLTLDSIYTEIAKTAQFEGATKA